MEFANLENVVAIQVTLDQCAINYRVMLAVPNMDNVKTELVYAHKAGMADIVHYVSVFNFHFNDFSWHQSEFVKPLLQNDFLNITHLNFNFRSR